MTLFRFIVAICLGVFLAACGGGGGSAGTSGFGTGSGTSAGTGTGSTTTTTAGASVVLSISSTTVSAAAPATVKAVVLDSTGTPQSGQVVGFTTSGGLGSFNVATALTDSTGTATVTLTPASATSNGADLVIAKVTLGTTALSGTIGFQVNAAATPPVGSPSIALVLSGTTVTASAPATVTATVTDAAGHPLSGQVVQFSSQNPLGTFSPSSALTGANGVAIVNLSPATATTNGAALAIAQATVSGTLLTAQAGFTVVSTGAPAAGTPSIALTLSSDVVTTSAPVTAVALVKDGTGAPVAGQVVKFSTVDGLGTFGVSSALTDATGKASVVLSAVGAGKSGADQVLASTTVNGTALQASQGFQLTVSSATIASFTSDTTTLGPYGQANLTVTVTGASAATPVSLSLSSACVALGKATLTPATATTTSGTATFTYHDGGCGANDASDPLQVSIVGTSVTQSLNIGLTSPSVSSIVFGTANPPVIYLQGTGLPQTSTVSFQVVDNAGNGLSNQTVTLQLQAAAGGVTIDGGSVAVSKLSDNTGHVSVLINSGTVPTPVRVKATLAGGIATVSSGLSIAVGLPSELNFSLSQGTRNIEGYEIDGTTNTYNIIASDRLSNPVPAGTSVNFIAEAGSVEPIKQTALVAGLSRATANFVSAGTRPLDGRVTVLAYALGEESFIDVSGKNVWDPTVDTQFQDLGAVFLSRKFLTTYFSQTDQLIPLSISGNASNVACAAITTQLLALDVSIPSVGGSTCDGTWGPAYVRRALETVLSTSTARPIWASAPANLYANPGASCPLVQDTASTPGSTLNPIIGYQEVTGNAERQSFYRVGGPTVLYLSSVSGVISFLVGDANPVRINPVAAGSTITVSATTGLTATLNGGSPVPSTLDVSAASVAYNFSVGTTVGTITINIASPSGVVTSVGQVVSANGVGSAPVGSTLCQ